MCKNRITLCVFYDENGEIKDFQKTYLEAIKNISTRTILIANGKISEVSAKYLNENKIELITRQNTGFDFGAWKDAILQLGWKEISSYENLLLTNFTCYGPIFPLEDVISEMDERICDFWGINRHPEQKNSLIIPGDSTSYVREHIQSYFLNIKQNLLYSLTFRSFWEELHPASTYSQEVAWHENKLTEVLEAAGYISDCYMNFKKYSLSGLNPSLFHSDDQLILDKNPLVKRKVFLLEPSYWIDSTRTGRQPQIIFDFLKRNYARFNEVVKDLTQSACMSDLQVSLKQLYIIDQDSSRKTADFSKIGFMYFVYYADLINQTLGNILALPKDAHILISSSSQSLLDKYKKELEDHNFANVNFQLVSPRGRDMSALLLGGKDFIHSFPFICFLHDKKTAQAGLITGKEYAYHNFHCNIASKHYVDNIFQIFVSNPEVGLLVPPSFAVGNEMGENEIELIKLMHMYRIKCPFDTSPPAPFGNMFWVRSAALVSVLDRVNLSEEDFPQEPMADDGTFNHAFERFIPMVAQESGYLTAWVATRNYYESYTLRQLYQLRKITDAMTKRYGILGLKAQVSCLLSSNAQCYNQTDQSLYKTGIKLIVLAVGRKVIKFKNKICPNQHFPRLKKIAKHLLSF